MTLALEQLRLYLVADPEHCRIPIVEAVILAVEAGVTAVQLRAKRLNDREHVDLARELQHICRRHGALFLVNDRLDIALLSEADGIHVGVTDISPQDIRNHCGKPFVIGYSPDTPGDEAGQDADYLGIGPVFGTSSKVDAGAALGIDEFRQRACQADLPVIGIGGIGPGSARAVIDAGAFGVAVVSSILGSPDIAAATRELAAAVRPAR